MILKLPFRKYEMLTHSQPTPPPVIPQSSFFRYTRKSMGEILGSQKGKILPSNGNTFAAISEPRPYSFSPDTCIKDRQTADGNRTENSTRIKTAKLLKMRSFKAVRSVLVAAMINTAFAVPGLHATTMILATTFVDAVVSSGFQHTVVTAPEQNKAGKVKPTNYAATCFSPSTFPRTGSGNSTLVPWTALADDSDPESEHAVSHTFKTLCKEISATILTRDIPVSRPAMPTSSRTLKPFVC